MNRYRRMIVSLLVSIIVVSGLFEPITYGAPTTSEVIVFTKEVGPDAYEVYIGNEKVARKLKVVPVEGVRSRTIRAKASPDGKYVAYVSNFNNTYGTSLHIIRTTDGKELLSLEGAVTDLAWSSRGERLAYTKLNTPGIETEFAPGRTTAPSDFGKIHGQLSVLTLSGLDTPIPVWDNFTGVLGFSSDARSVYAVRKEEFGQYTYESLVKVDLDTGVTTEVLASTPEGPYYRLFAQLQSPSGDPLFGYVTDTRLSAVGETENSLGLVNADGTNRQEFLPSADRYMGYIWSPGEQLVAFMQPNGIFIAHMSGSAKEQVTDEASALWKLEQFRDSKNLIVSNSRAGLALRGTRGRGPLPKQPDESFTTMSSANIWVPFIHQVYDTPDHFLNGGHSSDPNRNGGKLDACGPTSAVMAMVHLGRYGAWWITVDPKKFGPVKARDQSAPVHSSAYGAYVSEGYTHTWTDAYGSGRSAAFYTLDYYNSGRGAHGHMVTSFTGTDAAKLADFLSRQEIAYSWFNGSPSDTWLKNHLDRGRVLIVSHSHAWTPGHLSIVKGYRTDSAGRITHLIWHDTYGRWQDEWGRTAVQWGMYDGADSPYPVNTITVKYAVAVYLFPGTQ